MARVLDIEGIGSQFATKLQRTEMRIIPALLKAGRPGFRKTFFRSGSTLRISCAFEGSDRNTATCWRRRASILLGV
jgi:hypothetical protein